MGASGHDVIAVVREQLAAKTTPAGLTRLVDMTSAAVRAHPTVVLDPQQWCAYLDRKFCNSPYRDGPPWELRPDDLWLACGALTEVPAALRVLDELIAAACSRLSGAMAEAGVELEELTQGIRVDLLVGSDGTPKLQRYSGRGSLSRWIRSAAARRLALALKARGARSELGNALSGSAMALPSLPEFRALEHQQRTLFVQYLREAFFELDVRQRNLLRLHLIQGMSLAALGRQYRVHRTTMHRKVWQACEQLADRFGALARRSKVSFDAHALTNALRNGLNTSIGVVLASRHTGVASRVPSSGD